MLPGSYKKQTRSSLAGLFWSVMPEVNALANLRKILVQLKPVASHLILIRETLTFNKGLSYWLGVDVFLAAIHQTSRIEQLQSAASLYAGDFLDGFNLADAPLFDECVLAQPARLRETALRAKVLSTFGARFLRRVHDLRDLEI